MVCSGGLLVFVPKGGTKEGFMIPQDDQIYLTGLRKGWVNVGGMDAEEGVLILPRDGL